MQTRKTNIHTLSENSDAKHIAVLMGGPASEREVSISSSEGVVKSLLQKGYKVSKVDVGNDFAVQIQALNPDLAFNCLHGTYGEDGTIPAILNMLHIPYTHSGRLASAVAFDKLISRQIANYAGIKMPKSLILDYPTKIDGDPMQRPFVAKPVAEGSSVGVELYFEGDGKNFEDYDLQKYQKVVIEEYIPGIDVQAAVVGNKAIGAMEIEPVRGFYDYEAKYTDGLAKHYIPPRISSSVLKHLLCVTESIHKLTGARTISRSDFRVNPELGEEGVYFLEINTHPGFTPLSILPEIAASCNISFDDLVDMLLADAVWEK